MALVTFDVPFIEGRVCYLTRRPSSRYVTVECPEQKWAFRFDQPGRSDVRVGDWVRFRGKVRLDPGLRADGEPVCKKEVTYYHDPHDGSNRKDWLFFDMTTPESKVVAPPDVARTLRETLTLVRRHLDSWDANLDPESFYHTIAALTESTQMMQEHYRDLFEAEKDLKAPVSAIDLDL